MLLNEESPKCKHPNNLKIRLKEHQLAMLQRCIDIENIKDNLFGIMSDRPGTGKTYVILSIINYFKEQNNKIKNESEKTKENNENKENTDSNNNNENDSNEIYDNENDENDSNENNVNEISVSNSNDENNNSSNTVKNMNTNIIIVPQNIYSQWMLSIEKFSNNLTYSKFINYENIMSLYTKPEILKNTDIILTTSSYYHIIATTLTSLNINISRIFFDEIDSISNIIATKINSNFVWFVSASFNVDYLGYYQSIIKNYDINNIICKCENDFINSNIYLDEPIKKYYLCKNIYIDNILESVVTKRELKGLNAMNFTLNKKDFDKNKVSNEKEVIDLIIKNRKSIIDFNKFKIEESKQMIKHYTDCLDNSILYYENYKEIIDKSVSTNNLQNFKEFIVIFISNFQDFISLDVFKDEFRHKGVQSLKIVFDDIIDICYKLNDIDRICTDHLINKNDKMEKDAINMNIKKLNIIIGNILKTLNDIKEEDTIVFNLYEVLENNKNYYEDYLNKIIQYSDSVNAPSQIDIHYKQLEISNKLIDENQRKIDLIYSRLIENKCCPICYDQYEHSYNNKIYFTAKCCNNKICEKCVNEWYNVMYKTSCIFCNTSSVLLSDLIYCDIDVNLTENNNIINEELITEMNVQFETYNYNKAHFLSKYIKDLTDDKKIIIFSDYSSIFQYIETICDENKIKYVDLDKGNIKDIDNAVIDYKFGEAKILLSNSTLFGCGMNFENATDILFVHKMDKMMEKQVIGRAQRMGRKCVLNIIYLEYENESEFTIKPYKNVNAKYYNQDNDELDINDDTDINNELEKYYKNKQISNILDNVMEINFDSISGNEIVDNMTTSIVSINDDENNNDDVIPLSGDYIDVNLEELINSLT